MWNHFCNFGEGAYEEYFHVFILKIGQLAYEDMSFKEFSIFISGSYLVQQRGTILEISVKWYKRTISVKIF